MGASANLSLSTGEASFGQPVAQGETQKANPAAKDALLTTATGEDVVLLRGLKRGDREALAEVVTQHGRLIYAYLRARMLDPADAEDLCQEVFLRCSSGKVDFNRAGDLKPWLIGVARNVLREHIRSKAKRKETAWTTLCLEVDMLAAEQPAEPDDAVAFLPECLDSLGQSARQAIDLRYGSSLNLADIGTQLRRSEGAVKLLVFRARQALRKCLEFRLRQDEA